LITTAE